MKNSVIIRFFRFIIEKFLIIYNDSALERIISSVCTFFAKKAKGSVFCNFMSDDTRSGAFWKNSIAFKIIASPVRFILFLSEKLKLSFENSRIIVFLNNVLNISLKQYSKLFASSLLGVAIGMILKKDFHMVNMVLLSVFAFLAFVMSFIPASLKSISSSSIAVKICGGLFNKYAINTQENVIHKLGSLKVIMPVLFVVGLICGYISFVKSVIAIIAVIAILLILNNTILGIFLTVFLAPIMPTMVCAGVVILTTASYIIKLLRGKEKSFTITHTGAFIIGFLAIALFSSITSFNMSKSLQSYALYFVFALSYFLIVNNIKTKNQWYNLLVVYVLAGLLVGLYGVYQNYFITFTDTSWVDEDMFTDIKTRVYSTFDNPNVLGQYLVMVIPVAFAMMWSEKGAFKKLFYLCF